MAKEIAKRNWDFVLYEDHGQTIIEVAFFDKPIDYTRKFHLMKEEFTNDISKLSKLSEKIRNDYDAFKNREIP